MKKVISFLILALVIVNSSIINAYKRNCVLACKFSQAVKAGKISYQACFDDCVKHQDIN